MFRTLSLTTSVANEHLCNTFSTSYFHEMPCERRTMSTERTPFEKESAGQGGELRTRKIGLQVGLAVLGISVLCMVFFTWGFFFLEKGKWMPLLGMIGFGIGIVWGIFTTIRSLTSSVKNVTCPVCGTEHHQIFERVRKYWCPNCRALLLLGEDTMMMPQLSACSYCGLQTAVTKDHGRFLCSNCGIVRESSDEGEQETEICPECNQSVPEGAIYCKYCESILMTDFSADHDMDWKVGKDASGHMWFARALLKVIREWTSAKIDTEDTADLLAKKWTGAETNIEKTYSLLAKKMKEAFTSLEEALQEPECRTSAGAILTEIDLAYAVLLRYELQCVQAVGSKKFSPHDSLLRTWADEPHITTRERIVSILGDSPMPLGSIGKWHKKLLSFRSHGPSNDPNKRKFSIDSYERLEAEVNRFEAWKKQHEA